MGIKCVLISGAGIIICRGLLIDTELLNHCSQFLPEWLWGGVFSTAWLRLPHAQSKVSISKAAELRSQRDLRLTPCDAACGSTHVTSAVQKKAVYVHAETHQRVKVTVGHRFGFSKEFKSTRHRQQQRQRLLWYVKDVKKSSFLFPLVTKGLSERSCFSVLLSFCVLASVIWMCMDEAINARLYCWCNTHT